MFYITSNLLWAIFFFYTYVYILFVFSFILYNLPLLNANTVRTIFKTSNSTTLLEGSDLHWFLFTFVFSLFLINFTWSSTSICTWFGHIIFNSFQHKVFTFVLVFLFLTILFFNSTFIFGSYEINDFYIVCLNFSVWTMFLFSANSFFCVAFFIEILSTLILLLIATSTFSTTYFYTNVNYNLGSYHNILTSTHYFKSLLFFFWVSLVGSLGLFFFLVFFYTQFFTFDWNTAEHCFNYFINTVTKHKLLSFFFSWLFFFVCVFLKCGLVPFYFWKPMFFRGLPLPALFFYVFFFYFFIFLFFISLFFFYLNEIFYVFSFLFNSFLVIGIFAIFSILCDSYYLKTFFALSSILNTLFIFLVFSNLTSDFFLFLP